MVVRNPSNFKTRLCILYQREGRCPRETCTFAHGETELRRFTNTLNDRRDHRHNDLRDKLDRKRSPVRRHSPGKDERVRNSLRGNSPNRSPKISDRNRRMEIDDRSDFSGSAKISVGTDDHLSGRKQLSSNTRSVLHEHLRQVQSDIIMLDEDKYKLEVYLQERTHEADRLTSRIKELEAQLSQESEECKRITSKMKKFLKAHERHLHLQEELNRSQSRLQKLGEQLGSDSIRLGDNEDSNINILSDGGVASPRKKRPRINSRIATDVSKSDVERELNPVGMIGLEKRSRWDKNNVRADGEDNGYQRTRENMKKMEKNASFNVLSADKYKGGGGEQAGLPPTSMAAHAEDQVIEMIDGEENVDVVGIGSVGSQIEAAASRSSRRLPFLPPPLPPPPQNKYKGDNKNVNGNEEELVDVDIV
ncbi:zinc finger CCCH domain-containing protein 13 [Impatiens glandulifera]|uniref:zinc finger CCCH domain-containing protein 13 n=1 Tax=Impatiens glandulifera TaxID=253017 RepID=UPI001FB16772|nr:zinc finger CCCH domain-containing protein 13 [Impatiens glandulifera]